jgi:hypothetical protein
MNTETIRQERRRLRWLRRSSIMALWRDVRHVGGRCSTRTRRLAARAGEMKARLRAGQEERER